MEDWYGIWLSPDLKMGVIFAIFTGRELAKLYM